MVTLPSGECTKMSFCSFCYGAMDHLDRRRRYCSRRCKKTADNRRARERREGRAESGRCPRCGEESRDDAYYGMRAGTCADCRARATATKRHWRAERWLWGDRREQKATTLRRQAKEREEAEQRALRERYVELFEPIYDLSLIHI